MAGEKYSKRPSRLEWVIPGRARRRRAASRISSTAKAPKKEHDLFSDFLISWVRTDALNGLPSEISQPPSQVAGIGGDRCKGWLRGLDPISEFQLNCLPARERLQPTHTQGLASGPRTYQSAVRARKVRSLCPEWSRYELLG